MFKWLTTRRTSKRTADGIYGAIVAQSRLPVFYSRHGVPDTVTGRFEMIVLHMFLVLERLQVETSDRTGDAERLGQALNEAFVAGMDDAMREMGVADVRVSERMHQAAGAYFGRLMAYRKALEPERPPIASGVDGFAAAIARNILVDAAGGDADKDHAAGALASYARLAARHLAVQPFDTLMGGRVTFPAPDGEQLS